MGTFPCVVSLSIHEGWKPLTPSKQPLSLKKTSPQKPADWFSKRLDLERLTRKPASHLREERLQDVSWLVAGRLRELGGQGGHAVHEVVHLRRGVA